MKERDELIKLLIKEKGGSREDYLNLLDSIAYHESAGTLDPKMIQYGGGPGRGKYQFEKGRNAGAITAAKRTKQYYNSKNIPVPKWLNEITNNDDLDVINLSSEQQDILFLGNMRQHPKADFSKVWKGKETPREFWLNYHWAGKDIDRKDRIKAWEESMEKRNKKKINIKNDMMASPMPEGHITNPPAEPYNPASIPTQGGVPIMEAPSKITGQFNSSTINKLSFGGLVGTAMSDDSTNFIGAGNTHENNPNGGVYQGMGNNGLPNTAEENEFTWDRGTKGKYVFSNRIGSDGNVI